MSDEHYTIEDRMRSEVYLDAIKTCEELEKIQDNKIKKLENQLRSEVASNDELLTVQKRLEKRLGIATKALEVYANTNTWCLCNKSNCSYVDGSVACIALKEMEVVK